MKAFFRWFSIFFCKILNFVKQMKTKRDGINLEIKDTNHDGMIDSIEFTINKEGGKEDGHTTNN